MKPTNIGAIHLSFGMQAEEFEKPGMNFSNRDYLDYCVRTIEPASTDSYWKSPREHAPADAHFPPLHKPLPVWTRPLPCWKSGKKKRKKTG